MIIHSTHILVMILPKSRNREILRPAKARWRPRNTSAINSSPKTSRLKTKEEPIFLLNTKIGEDPHLTSRKEEAVAPYLKKT